MQLDFSGKTAVVTGASSGIGAATARLLAAAGASVVLAGRDRDRLERVKLEIEGSGGSARTAIGDLTDERTPRQVAESAVGARGAAAAIDVVVHCAGLLEKGTVREADVDSIDRMWNVNARAPMLLTKALIPHLADGSSMVFVSSTVAHVGFPAYAPYSAAKGAIEAFARALAVELAPATRVNVVAPGFAETPMLTDQYPENPTMEEWIVSRTPVGFVGSAEDIARTILAVACSTTGRYITGSTIVCDGGWVAAG